MSTGLVINNPAAFRDALRKMNGYQRSPEEKEPMIGTFFNLTPEMHDRMVAAARDVNVPISQFCRTALGAFLADMEDTPRTTCKSAVLGVPYKPGTPQPPDVYADFAERLEDDRR